MMMAQNNDELPLLWYLRTLSIRMYTSSMYDICKMYFQKCSNELSTKAPLVWKYALVDSTSRIQTVLEWVFLQVILPNSCF